MKTSTGVEFSHENAWDFSSLHFQGRAITFPRLDELKGVIRDGVKRKKSTREKYSTSRIKKKTCEPKLS